MEQRKWLEQVEKSLHGLSDEEGSGSAIWTVDYLNKTIEAGERLIKHAEIENHLVTLNDLKRALQRWETKAHELLHSRQVEQKHGTAGDT